MRPRSGRWPRCQLKMVLTHRRTVLTVDFKLSSDWNKLKKKKSFSNKTKKQNNRLVLFLTKPKHFVIIFFFFILSVEAVTSTVLKAVDDIHYLCW